MAGVCSDLPDNAKPLQCCPNGRMKQCQLTARFLVAAHFVAGVAVARLSAVERSSTFAGADSNAASTRDVAAAEQTPVAPDTVDYTRSQSAYTHHACSTPPARTSQTDDRRNCDDRKRAKVSLKKSVPVRHVDLANVRHSDRDTAI